MNGKTNFNKMIKIIRLSLIFVLIILVCYKNTQALQAVERQSAFRDAKKAKIIVSQSYDKADEVSLPFKEIIVKLLQYAGIKEDSINYDIVVKIDAIGYAVGANYMGGYYYSGAILKGSVIFEAMNGVKFTEQFNEAIEPSENIVKEFYSPNNPNTAPFRETFFHKVLPTFMISIYKPLGITPINAALKSEEEYVCVAAAEALGSIKDSRAIEPLIAALKNTRENARHAAAKALDMIDPNWNDTETAKNAIPLFIAALEDKVWRIRIAAAEALGSIKDKRAVKPLITALKNEKDIFLCIAAEALGNINDSRSR